MDSVMDGDYSLMQAMQEFDPRLVTPDLVDEITVEKSPQHFLKGRNILEPLCIADRKFDKSLERKLLLPRNPTF